ncbi:phosphoribosylamine--glycine ligase [Coprothermobacter proteolyticus]|uniref:phosphoribosylamine--glycine ligase n=1 Tax=Coprothermobacter proteolyticus TaxID=35786 RepID=UPI000D2FED30|nr:phosphoribosylamine--glycine ligase [Coprothermobacter proteolyticus]
MNVLVIGSGGREHALIYKLKQSPLVQKIYCAPGNAGIAQMAELVNLAPTEVEKLRSFALKKSIDLIVVGPEVPLMEGIVDVFEEAGLTIFGPSKGAALLEGSKVFAKNLMKRCHVPTAEFEVFSRLEDAIAYVKRCQRPLVVKADGLAQGKGVVIAHSSEEAAEALESLMEEKVFGSAGEKVVVEELLQGVEASVFSLCNGTDAVILGSAMDYKRAFDGDQGPNTGGMGSISPHPLLTREMQQGILETIIKPVLRGLMEEGVSYSGVLYAGIMLTEDRPKVLEFNVRFGDPETQAMMPLLDSDLAQLLIATCTGNLHNVPVQWKNAKSVCVVAASKGYPGHYEVGYPINGLNNIQDAFIFHAGTKFDQEGNVLTSGGRVLSVVATGKSYEEARQKAYKEMEKISFPGMFYRKDIAFGFD